MKLPKYKEGLVAKARELRSSGTPGEARLWPLLKNRQLGLRFRRQRPIGNYIVDFLCPGANLVVELDGYSHERKGLYDLKREEYLKALGFEIFTYTEREALVNPEAIADSIWRWLVDRGYVVDDD